MTNAPKHRAVIFSLDTDGGHRWDASDRAIVERIVECDDLAEAQRIVREAIAETGSHAAASLSVAVERFAESDLAGYIAALNFGAKLLEKMPKEGTYISELATDPAHWAEMGVETPRHLADYLDGCFEREMQKAMMA